MFKSLVWYSVFTLAAATEIIKLEPPNVNGFLIDRDAKISDADLANIKFYSQHAAAAYCNFNTGRGRRIRCRGQTCPLVMRNRPMVVASTVGNLTGIGVYMAVDTRRKEVVLSLRGSNNIRNYITDVVFAWSDCDLTGGCKLHAGFLQAWDEIKDRITAAIKKARRRRPNYRLVVTGHSLGGAVATVAAAHLRAAGLAVDLYTYGSPRVGNDAFAIWFGRQRGGEWRVTHEDDPVPRLPPLFLGYRHTSPEYWLFGGESATTSYTVSHISVCRGIANVDCNAARWNTDPVAHLYYLGATSACAESPLQVRAAAYGQDALPQDVKDRLTAWSLRDQQQFVKEVET